MRGNNVAGFSNGTSSTVFEAGAISIKGSNGSYFMVLSAGNINYVKYNHLNIEGYFEKRMKYLNKERNVVLEFKAYEYNNQSNVFGVSKVAVPSNNTNFSRNINITNLAVSKRSYLSLKVNGEYFYSGNDGDYWTAFTGAGWQGLVYHIWLS